MNEKRQYFRVQQDVIFNFKCVNTDAVNYTNAEQHFHHASALSLFSQFQQLDNNSHQLLKQIRHESEHIAEYLVVLNQKINLLSQQVLSGEAVAVNDSETGRINLSQGGLAFNTNHPIGVESWVAVKLVFLPSYTGIVTYAQVTRNQLLEDDTYLIGASFHQLNEEQKKVIANQVIHAQTTIKQPIKSQLRH